MRALICRASVAALSLAVLSVLPCRSAAPDRVRFERLTRADGVTSELVYQILQDRQGFLWFSTKGGLNRYDGYQTVNYPGFPIDTDLAAPGPGLLYEDRNGTFWAATRVLSSFDPGGGASTRFTPPQRESASSSPVKVTAVHDDASGFLWIGTTVCREVHEEAEPILYRFDPRTGASTPYAMDAGEESFRRKLATVQS